MPTLPVAVRRCAGVAAALGAFLLAPVVAHAEDPTAPAVVVSPGNAALHVAWSHFAPDSAVSSYSVTAVPAEPTVAPTAVTTAADATDTDVVGLANGMPYDVTVAAVAADGTQVAAPVTPVAVPRTVPGQPVVTSIVGLDGSAKVGWTAPADDGGAAVTAYVVQSDPNGGPTVTLPADARTAVLPGLADGAAVSLRVAAVNDAGTGVPSTPVATTPRKPARLVVTTKPRPVTYGTSSTVAAQVLSTQGVAVGNARVELRGRAVGTRTWHTLATAMTNGTGRASLRAALHVNTVLTLHHATDGVIAPDMSVGTARVSYRVTAPTRPRALRINHPVNIAGHITPARRAGTKVVLQHWSLGAWRTMLTGRVGARSSYRFTWTPTQPGNYALRTITPHDAVRGAGTSAVWHQHVAAENAADVATEILHNSRITLADAHESGVSDAATALHNVQDVAAGRAARRSAYQNAPGGSTRLTLGLLRAIRAMGARLTVTISEVTGGSHAVDSGHYEGRAVDVTVINGRSVAAGAHYAVIVNICRANGATKVFDPGHDPDGGHSDHVHCEWS